LSPGGQQEVVAADNQGDALLEIVDDGCKLIRPMIVAITDQEITALLRRTLLLQPVPPVIEVLN